MEVIRPSFSALDADVRATISDCNQKQAATCSSSSGSSSSSNSSSSSPSTSKPACPSLLHSGQVSSRAEEEPRRLSISNWLEVWGIEVNALCTEINEEAERARCKRERMIREQALLVVASLEQS